MKLLGSIWTLPVLVGLLTMVVFSGSLLQMVFSVDILRDFPGIARGAIIEAFRWFMAGFLGTVIVLTYVRVSRQPWG